MSLDKSSAMQQQKLKLKMISIDNWSKREQLCLASSVLRSGDQNWVSVSRSLKPFAEPNRPEDWLSARNCALQYNTLLDKAGAHKRKRGERHPSSGSGSQQGETPGEIILKQLTQERIEELQQQLEASRKEYRQIKKEIDLLQEGKLDEKLDEMCKKIDDENLNKELERTKHLKWLEERERKTAERDQAFKQHLSMQRSPSKDAQRFSQLVEMSEQPTDVASTSSPAVTEQLNIDVTNEETVESTTESKAMATPVANHTSDVSTAEPHPPPPVTPSSPLLTSLLRSPTTTSPIGTKGLSPSIASKLSFSLASPTGLSTGLKNLLSSAIGDESPSKTATTPVGATSSGSAPTLTRLLELPLNAPGKPLPELATSEEKKTVEETQGASAPAATTEATTAPVQPAPPVTESVVPCAEPVVVEEVKVETVATTEEVVEESDVVKIEEVEASVIEEQTSTETTEPVIEEPAGEQIVGTEVEISDTGSTRIEESAREVETETVAPAPVETQEVESHEEKPVAETVTEETTEPIEDVVKTEPSGETEADSAGTAVEMEIGSEVEGVEAVAPPEPVQVEAPKEETEKSVEIEVEMRPEPEASTVQETSESTEAPAKVPSETEPPVEEPVPKSAEEKNAEEAELKEKIEEKAIAKPAEIESAPAKSVETTPLTRRPLRRPHRKTAAVDAETGEEKAKSDIGPSTRRSTGRRAHIEEPEQPAEQSEEWIESNTPAGGSSMKKKPPPLPLQAPLSSPAPSSGIDSTPNSPTSSISTVTEDDRDHRTWKKSILLVWRELSGHKNASLFQKPINEEHVPGYRSLVFRPIDLSTIKKNIESGLTRTTTEFHRDVTLMFLNSIFYNPSDHEVHRLAKEMLAESNTVIQEYVNAQLLAQSSEPIRPARRETRDSTRRTESMSSSHDEAPGSAKPEEGKTRAAKRASMMAVAVSDEPKKRRSRNPVD